MHYASRPVLAARPSPHPEFLSVILAADGSLEAQGAANFLCRLALPPWAEVTVVSVAEVTVPLLVGERVARAEVPAVAHRALLEGAEAHAAEIVKCLQACAAQVRSAVRFGHPAGEILAAAREHEADLIVIGALGQTRAEPVPLGGAAHKVVKYAPCSVLVVR